MKGLIAVTLLILAGLTLGLRGIYSGYSQGERTGTVTKVSRKGLIWKSWEGQMALGGFRAAENGAGVVSNVWEFSTTDYALALELQAASEAGEPITLRYHEWLSGPVWLETSHEVEGVKK